MPPFHPKLMSVLVLSFLVEYHKKLSRNAGYCHGSPDRRVRKYKERLNLRLFGIVHVATSPTHAINSRVTKNSDWPDRQTKDKDLSLFGSFK
ncbi:hypothetical protein KXD40_007569 [Peronospora effusa]|nr:hypothetical protein KXD40_007569 [Peronospora effusa]